MITGATLIAVIVDIVQSFRGWRSIREHTIDDVRVHADLRQRVATLELAAVVAGGK